MKKELLTIIPMRSGSKRVKDKNIRTLAGEPLFYWTLKSAQESQLDQHLIVSTDSKEYQKFALLKGAQAPFIRSANAASDKATSFDVVTDAILQLSMSFEYVMLLQPTSPLKSSHQIQQAYKSLKEQSHLFDSLVSVTKVEYPVEWCQTIEDGSMRNFFTKREASSSQGYETRFRPNGAIFISKVETILQSKSFYMGERTLAFEMPFLDSIDIDSPDEFHLAEIILKSRLKN